MTVKSLSIFLRMRNHEGCHLEAMHAHNRCGIGWAVLSSVNGLLKEFNARGGGDQEVRTRLIQGEATMSCVVNASGCRLQSIHDFA